jgi:carboxyl-terminal processing protease
MDELNKFTTPQDFTANYNNLEAHVAGVGNLCCEDSIDLKQVSGADKDYLQKRIKAQLARFKWRSKGFYEVINGDDPAIKKALEVLEK